MAPGLARQGPSPIRNNGVRMTRLVRLTVLVVGFAVSAGNIAAAQDAAAPVVLELDDYATVPMTGRWGATGNLSVIARMNFMRQEPGPDGRFFVNDLNGPLYIVDRVTRQFTVYLDLNGRDGAPGIFERLGFPTGLGQGFVSFQFDPDYARNGRFYTVHVEELAAGGTAQPRGGSVPGLDLTGYATTDAVPVVGGALREGVVVEWTDTNIANDEFEGRAREILRMQLGLQLHPTGDMIFNPSARSGDPDWRVMYLTVGDGGSGEQKDDRRHAPQRLDMMVGKLLRIVPDLTLHTSTSTVSPNGRYRIPNDNPFVSVVGALKEVWALGLRNPHRLFWDVDPTNTTNSRLVVMSIGLRSWESVYFVTKGANFGYSEREGNQVLDPSTNLVTSFEGGRDELPVRVGPTETRGMMPPTYPVLQYNRPGGFAIAGGVVYRGARLPDLQGKFLFGDLLTGRMWVADFADMLKADDGRRETTAPFREVRIRWRNPVAAVSEAGPIETMRPMTVAAYDARRQADPDAATAKAPGRVDIRFAMGNDGELYVMTKADGMIRAVVGAEVPSGP